MIVVGLTGGIGSGKSTVANFFIELGIPVYVADDHAKRLMQTSKVVKHKLIKEFGAKTFKGNQLNRAYLAEIVFNDKKKLQAIGAIVHPSVSNSFKRWVSKQASPYVIQENAIIFENNTAKKFDYIITVTASEQEKIRRVMQRDQVTRQQVHARMQNQLPDELKISQSDFVIDNEDLKTTRKKVKQIHQKLVRLAKQ